jgi:hypothetical protein
MSKEPLYDIYKTALQNTPTFFPWLGAGRELDVGQP